MIAPRYARLVAEIIKRETRVETESLPSSCRAEDITLVERAMERRTRRGRHWRRGIGAAGALAIALAVFGVARSHRAAKVLSQSLPQTTAVVEETGAPPPHNVVAYASHGASLATSGVPGPLENGTPLTPGSRLVVDHGAGATLSLSTGTHLDVDPGSEVTVLEQGRTQVFALNKGALRADVVKLADGGRFVVRTPDAEVEVRGTSFQVSVVPPDPSCGRGTATRVNVYEGVVVVRKDSGEDAVQKGETWPGRCAPAASLAPPAKPTSKRAGRIGTRPSPPPPRSTTEAPSSTLTEENDMFAEAMIAVRGGSVPTALAAIERFLDRYPHSHLAENAAAERMRLLRPVDATRAFAAARLYLVRYPKGFARTEAEAILAKAP